MKQKYSNIFKILLTTLLVLVLGALMACNPQGSRGGVKVVFMLEGGSYQNGKEQVVQYYDFPEGSDMLIKPLGYNYKDNTYDPENCGLTYQGFVLEGWYRTKNSDGTYSGEWNFDTDTVGQEGVTLYANWQPAITYCYQVYDADTKELISTSIVGQNVSFRERYIPTLYNKTWVQYFDESGAEWSDNSPRPTEENPAVKVFVKYVEGVYTLVRTPQELLTAAESSNANIYLCNDIDMQGASLCFEGFSHEFRGNGHTISNFKVSYSAQRNDLVEDFEDDSKTSLAISLFANPDGANIHDVNFEQVIVEVDTTLQSTYKIYVAPIAVWAKDVTVSNVSVQCTVSIVKLPDSIDADRSLLVINTDQAFCYSQNCTTENVTLKIVTQPSQDQAEGTQQAQSNQ